jgi:hypothetical protein
MKSNTYKFAELELDILSKAATDPENRPIIEPFRKEILSLCEKFGKSGQSGGSAPFTATELSRAIKKLCLQEPISPIMGIDEEWMDVAEMNGGEILYQNKRCSGLFKNNKGRCWYIDAIIWKIQEGIGTNGKALAQHENITVEYSSHQYIKGFPFIPKTFYIDCDEIDIGKNNWERFIRFPEQLKAVFNYYDRE